MIKRFKIADILDVPRFKSVGTPYEDKLNKLLNDARSLSEKRQKQAHRLRDKGLHAQLKLILGPQVDNPELDALYDTCRQLLTEFDLAPTASQFAVGAAIHDRVTNSDTRLLVS